MQQSYLPTMPEDHLEEVRTALLKARRTFRGSDHIPVMWGKNTYRIHVTYKLKSISAQDNHPCYNLFCPRLRLIIVYTN